MESIFDHEVYEQELSSLLIRKKKQEYLESTSRFKRYSDMYHLFLLRGNKNKAEEVYRKFIEE